MDNVALRSGIALSNSDLRYLLSEDNLGEWFRVYEMPLDTKVGVRPEFIVDSVLILRHRIGNIPEPSDGIEEATDILRPLRKRSIDLDELFWSLHGLLNPYNYETNALDQRRELIQLARDRNISNDCYKLLRKAFEVLRGRILRLDYDTHPWDGATPLSDLYDVELKPTDPECYLYQRFIDFIAARGEALYKIHWRNFERLCAEFFKRRGYIVKLGPGRSDGGVDIRVWRKIKLRSQCPPLVMIQCKRLKSGGRVKVEIVKAFWTDVNFEKAQSGLIVTSGSIMPAGKRIANTRRWPLSFAEGTKVRKWVYSMWRIPWNRRYRRKSQIRYLVPPVVNI